MLEDEQRGEGSRAAVEKGRKDVTELQQGLAERQRMAPTVANTFSQVSG